MSFPTNLDTFVTHANGDIIDPDYDNEQQAALVSVETKIGVDGSADPDSHDFKLSLVTTTDKALPRDAAATTTNKTLGSGTKITIGSDADKDMYYRASDGTLTRIPVGTDNQILKLNGTTPNWEAETTVIAATESAEGISRLATAAQITAGTATESGYPLVVTPDQLASSTPVFNGSGLTNLTNGFLTSGAPGTTTTNTTATVLTYALAGGTLGTNRGVRIRASVQVAIAATNNNATYTIAYGGTTVATFGYSGNSGTPTVTIVQVVDLLLMGSGATGTQRASSILPVQITSGSGGALVGSGLAASASSAIDSTASQNITIACTAGASVTGTLLDYFIQKV